MPYQTAYMPPYAGIPSPSQSGGMMYAGGPGGDPGGLLGSPSNYSYPLTGGLMGAMSKPGAMQSITDALRVPSNYSGPDYTQTALQLAGNPHAGPYATNLGTVGGTIPRGAALPSAGATSGGSSGSSILGGLLGAVEKNPGLVKNAWNLATGASSAPAAASGAAGAAPVVTDGTGAFAPGAASVADTAGGTTTTFGDGLGTTTTFGGDAAGAGAGDAAGTTTTFDSGLLGSADTGGATAGADAGATAAGDSGAAAGAGDAAGSSGGLGAGAGMAAALAPLALTFWASQKYPAVQLDASYWSGLGNNLKGGMGSQSFYPAAMEALNTPADQVPDAIKQQVWASGYAPYGSWGMATPTGATMADYWGTGANSGGRQSKRV